MKIINTDRKYEWKYCSVGGVVRVNIETGEDIAHLGELDQKLWTALCCPVEGLEMDPDTLRMMDTDSDGKIRVPEVVEASRWLSDIVVDNDLILKGESSIALSDFNLESPTGRRLHDSAVQILKNLGRADDRISMEDTRDETAIFAGTTLNGDGIIIPESVKDPQLSQTVEDIMSTLGSVTDRSGAQGVDAALIESFYDELSAFSAWAAEGSSFQEGMEDALSSLEAVRAKIDDYFIRCSVIAFDEDAAPSLDVSLEKIEAIGACNLSECGEQLSLQPISRPTKDRRLNFSGINPAWQARVDDFLSKVIKEGDSIDEAQWREIQARFDAFKTWRDAKKSTGVESLGLEKVNAILSAGGKASLLEVVSADKALEQEAASIKEVDRFLHLYRDFYKLLRNFVIFSDFYNRNPDTVAVFEAGTLYIDQRCCRLCIKVSDMGAHADMASLSGMFLIYCHCSHKSRQGDFDVVAVMTDGDTKNLRPGKNALFYDRAGNDWDAVVTKIVDNPISIKAAFWSPYRKFWEFCVGIINKSASEKESQITGDLQSVAANITSNTAEPRKPAFDIAKFAGIFAALGMGLGMLADAVMGVFKGIVALEWWQLFAFAAGFVVVISGPSCFIAWTKLRKRNLGPVLNANGWAINSVILVNVPFGGTLTSTAKYPLLKLEDPFAKKSTSPLKILISVTILLIALAGALYLTDNLGFIGVHRKAAHCESVLQDESEVKQRSSAAAPSDTLLIMPASDTAE